MSDRENPAPEGRDKVLAEIPTESRAAMLAAFAGKPTMTREEFGAAHPELTAEQGEAMWARTRDLLGVKPG